MNFRKEGRLSRLILCRENLAGPTALRRHPYYREESLMAFSLGLSGRVALVTDAPVQIGRLCGPCMHSTLGSVHDGFGV